MFDFGTAASGFSSTNADTLHGFGTMRGRMRNCQRIGLYLDCVRQRRSCDFGLEGGGGPKIVCAAKRKHPSQICT
jgi:hypothetical protein